MTGIISKLFEDKELVEKIKARLPYLFYIAELESSRAGKVGMQVGSARENIIIALLIYKFGEENVNTDIPITEPEVDVKVYNEPISIKTKKGKALGGVKIIWTSDVKKVNEFFSNYYPKCDILFVNINWWKEDSKSKDNGIGGFYYIPVEVQRRVFEKIGREQYIKRHPPGRNPRGPEISSTAMKMLISNQKTKKFTIFWKQPQISYQPYKRWLDYWKKDI